MIRWNTYSTYLSESKRLHLGCGNIHLLRRVGVFASPKPSQAKQPLVNMRVHPKHWLDV